jgi:tRNA pseudouridine55 synthase
MKHGFLLINKPEGPTSFNIVAKIRRIFGIKKVGHCGTLDPLADGLLVVALGNATRLIQYLSDDKIYEFEVIFGKKSETGDREGKIIGENEKIPTKDELFSAIPKFIGEISQTPPAFSAIKIDGKRAYELARAGEKVEMQSRKIKIYSLELLNYDFEQKSATFRAHCSNGTYIRSLAQDIAETCGTLGYCLSIKRTAVGNLKLENAVSAEDANEKDIIPFDKAISFPKMKLDESEYKRVKNGNFVSSSAGEVSLVWLEFNQKIIALGKSEEGKNKPILVFL